MKGDAVAAEAGLPAARSSEQRAAETAAGASRRLQEAIAGAASDAAAELFPRLQERLAEFLAVEGLLRGLEIALRTAGNKNESSAYFAAASKIADAIAEIKRNTGASINVAAGERLLAILASDASAGLR